MSDGSHDHISGRRLNLLLLCSALLLVVAAAFLVLQFLGRGEVHLTSLSLEDRVRLLQEADAIDPAVFESFPASGEPLFYRLTPNALFEGAFGDTFPSNNLGFRSRDVTPRRDGVFRIVVVGDSWTFGPQVPFEEVFSQRLERLLNRDGEFWEVFNVSMVGWNLRQEIAALEVFLPSLDPDVVVLCPTSNDIDDSVSERNGRLTGGAFSSGAIFRRSYEYERRWIEAFREMDHAIDRLDSAGIQTLVYFLAEWRELAPYYASKAGFRGIFTTVPTRYIEDAHRLDPGIDPGRHASPLGHERIAQYLFNCLLRLEIVRGVEREPLFWNARFTGHQVDPALVEEEFAFWRPFALQPNLSGFERDAQGTIGLYSVPAERDRESIAVEIEPLPSPALYPLRIDIRVLAPTECADSLELPSPPAKTPLRKEFRIPESLKGFEFYEVEVRADRAVCLEGDFLPTSLKRPGVRLR